MSQRDLNDSTAVTSGYEALLAELAPLVKSIPMMESEQPAAERDAARGAAAKKAAMEAARRGKGADSEDGAGDEDEDEDEMFGKSFRVTLDDGTETDVFDGTEMMKALAAKNGELTDDVAKLGEAFTKAVQHNVDLAKALNAHGATIQKQDDLIKSMQADIARIGGQGAGRRAVVNVHDKPATTVAFSDAAVEGVKPQEFMELMTKAWSEKGAFTSHEVQVTETLLGMGQQPADDIKSRLQKALGQ